MVKMTYQYIQELLDTSDATEGSKLIPKKIYDTLIDEVDKNLIPRSEAAIYFGPGDIPGSSIDVDTVNPNSLDVRRVAEGAELPIDEVLYSSTNLKPEKYGVAIRITRELLEDAKWNILQHNVKIAGKRFAEKETELILTALQACTNNVGGGAAATIANVTEAMMDVENNDYTPTSLLVGYEFLNDLRNIDTFVEADKLGSREMLERGFVGTLYGLNVLKFSTNAAPTTTYAKYAYVYDKEHAYMIAEKRPVTIENFDLPVYDMSAASITQRIKVSLLRDLAICRISTS